MPSTMNSDRGSAFGSKEYVSLLASMHMEQSMDDRGEMEGQCADGEMVRDPEIGMPETGGVQHSGKV